MFEDFDIITDYLKLFVILIGAIAALGKLKDSFASVKRKQELKLDLEILEKLKQIENVSNPDIEEKINQNLKKAFEGSSEHLKNFLLGIAVFVGFGMWTIDILKSSQDFNAWVILTLSCSLMGLTMIFGTDDNKEDKGVFYQVAFYDKTNFRLGFVLTVLTGILTPILILKQDSFTFWQFLSGLFFIVGLRSLVKNTKRIKNSG